MIWRRKLEQGSSSTLATLRAVKGGETGGEEAEEEAEEEAHGAELQGPRGTWVVGRGRQDSERRTGGGGRWE